MKLITEPPKMKSETDQTDTNWNEKKRRKRVSVYG